MKADTAKGVTLGALVAFLPAIGMAWAFGTTAAEHVVRPHLAESKVRVEMMCAWAKAQEDRARAELANVMSICDTVGARCKVPPEIPPNPLLDRCGLEEE